MCGSTSVVLSFAPHGNICRSGALGSPAAVRAFPSRDQGRGLGCPSGERTFASPARPPSLLWLRWTPEPSGRATGLSTGCPTRRFMWPERMKPDVAHFLSPVKRRLLQPREERASQGPVRLWGDSTFLSLRVLCSAQLQNLHNYFERGRKDDLRWDTVPRRGGLCEGHLRKCPQRGAGGPGGSHRRLPPP